MHHLPSYPSARDRSALARSPSSSPSTGYGPSTAASPNARAATSTRTSACATCAPAPIVNSGMPSDAARSPGPSTSASRPRAAAIRSHSTRPSAVSICASAGTGSPATSSGDSTLGSTTTSGRTSATSARSSVEPRFTRTATVGARQSRSRTARAAISRAASLRSGATASSRSTITWSTSIPAALVSFRSSSPGTVRQERRRLTCESYRRHMHAAPRLRGGWVVRTIWLVTGLFFCALGILAFLESRLGLPPWDVLHQGIAKNTPLSFGVANEVVALLVLFVAWLLGSRPGPGTVANAALIGLFVALVQPTALVQQLASWPVGARVLLLAGGLALFGVGSAFYIGAAMGAGPRDSLMLVGARRTHTRIGVVRAALELSVLVIGFALGGTVGVGTLVFAALIGPAVEGSFWLVSHTPLVE